MNNERKPTVLITAFEPFGGDQRNSSEDVLGFLQAPWGWGLSTLILPVRFGDGFEKLREQLTSRRPEIVVCLGQDGSRSQVSVERLAVNLMDAPIADNAGFAPRNEPIRANGAIAYWSDLAPQIYDALEQAAALGLPIQLSSSAGLFVCNRIFYDLMHVRQGQQGWAGFVHVPRAETLALAKTAQCLQFLLDHWTRAYATCFLDSGLRTQDSGAPRASSATHLKTGWIK